MWTWEENVLPLHQEELSTFQTQNMSGREDKYNHIRALGTFSLLSCLQILDVILSKMDTNHPIWKRVQRARNVPRYLPSARAPGLHFIHLTWTSSSLILLLLSGLSRQPHTESIHHLLHGRWPCGKGAGLAKWKPVNEPEEENHASVHQKAPLYLMLR